uniref:RdRp n=1 Tax=viral metagenome TaxID=1070528 RepID=A0A2V0RH14_9ZZZZ
MIRSENYTDNKSGFRSWLERLTEPVDEDLRTPIWDPPKDRAELRDKFLDYVPLTGRGYSAHMEEREQKELKNILLPWSERPAWADWGPKAVAKMYERKTGALSTLNADMERFRSRWGVNVQPLPIRKVWHRLPSATSSGLPWLQSHWKEQIGAGLAAEVQHLWEQDKPMQIPPSMPMWRVDPPGKTRLAWAESKYEALFGAPFVYPLADAMRNLPQTPFSAWRSPSYTADTIQQHMRSADCEEYLSVDYSSYDATQSPELVQRVWNDLISPMYGNAKPRITKMWLENFTNGPLITPNGLTTGPHGVPSGSVATNFVDSINNALCIEGYLANYDIDSARYWVQGDDALICGKKVEPKDFAEFAQSEYGFEAHPEKQHYGVREADFLRMSYYVENDYKPTYPASRVAWRMTGYERFKHSPKDWNKWAVVVRAIQQANNAIDHPYVDDLVRWAADGDKLRLGRDLPPRKVFQLAGKAADKMTQARAAWDFGAETTDWSVLPIQDVIRRVVPPLSYSSVTHEN